MSSHTQSKSRHSAGRSFLTLKEKQAHTPWYASKAYSAIRDGIARRVAMKVEASKERRRIREIQRDLDRKNGIVNA